MLEDCRSVLRQLKARPADRFAGAAAGLCPALPMNGGHHVVAATIGDALEYFLGDTVKAAPALIPAVTALDEWPRALRLALARARLHAGG